jgi:hypothetical protein
MFRKNLPLLLTLLIAAVVLFACAASDQAAASAVETYLQALVEKDQDRLLTSICPAWEMDALLELDALSLIETTLSDLSCEQTASSGDQAEVVCQGSLDATYGTEIQKFDLSGRTFLVERSGSDWLVCGYR